MAASRLAVAGAPAVIERAQSDGARTYLSESPSAPSLHPSLDLAFDAAAHKAFAKLCVRATCRDSAKKVNVYLFVYPERVLSLDVFDDQAQIPTPVQAVFTRRRPAPQPIVALRFTLRAPADVIGPAYAPLVPSTNASRHLLQSLHALASATQFTVYLAEDISRASLDALVADIRDGSVRSIGFDANVDTLYGGKGGKVLQPEGAAVARDSPPSYDELALTPPPPASRKRLRTSPSPSSTSLEPPSSLSGTSAASKHPRLRAKRSFDKIDALAQQVQQLAHQVSTMQEELRALVDTNKPCNCCSSNLAGRLDQVERVVGSLQSQLPEPSDNDDDDGRAVSTAELDARLDEIRSEAEDMMDSKIEDRILDIKDELRDLVQDELKDVEDRVKDEVRTAIVTIDF